MHTSPQSPYYSNNSICQALRTSEDLTDSTLITLSWPESPKNREGRETKPIDHRNATEVVLLLAVPLLRPLGQHGKP